VACLDVSLSTDSVTNDDDSIACHTEGPTATSAIGSEYSCADSAVTPATDARPPANDTSAPTPEYLCTRVTTRTPKLPPSRLPDMTATVPLKSHPSSRPTR
jgi:hypothetical protein